MRWVSLTIFLTFLALFEQGQSRPNIFDLDLSSFFNFPDVRRGRATHKTALPIGERKNTGSVSVAKDAGQEAEVIASLIDAVMKEVVGGQPKALNVPKEEQHIPVEVLEFEPRNVDQMKDFGSRLGEFEEAEEPAMDLENLNSQASRSEFLRQTDTGVTSTGGGSEEGSGDDDEIRCIQKVMQVEETVYDRAIKCHHSYQEKCHMTYITDYQSSTEEKCETTFKKNCHITFRPIPFNETVRVCHNPLVRTCNNDTEGEPICNTYYETVCETSYKSYEVEQDEPICKMELMKKCDNVTINVPEELRAARQDNGANVVTVDQNCEEWPVQTCKLEKKKVKKVHPDTACKKIPREVCVPNNCIMAPGEEVCRDESRMQVQNVPQEECDLQPEETCHMEAVLVPRLVPKPNCVKVPKEICVNSKTNPRVVKKPVIKDWCYRPSELKETPEIIPPSPDTTAPGFLF